jgi:hypothetical protein
MTGRVRLFFWCLLPGLVVLYVFFSAIGGLSPAQVLVPTAVTTALSAMSLIRAMRINRELASPFGDPSVREACNRQRERRGF